MQYTTPILALIVAAALLAVAAPSQAIYIQTPLLLDGPTHEADVGDTIDFDIKPHPEDANATRDWAGKDVRIGFSYDKNENARGEGPDDAVDDSGQTEATILPSYKLSDDATGSFTWTVPSEVDDLNVHLFIESADGEHLASYNVAIGNATPMMYAMSGPGETPEIDEGGAVADEDDEAAEASAIGMLGLIGLAGAAMLGAAHARRRD